MTNTGTKFTVRLKTAVSACLFLVSCATVLVAQETATPRGVRPPLPNTPDAERGWERTTDRKQKKWGARAPSGRPVLGDIRKDFAEIQSLNNQLIFATAAPNLLNYKYISDSVGRMKTLAVRLNSNLGLGRSQVEVETPEIEYSDSVLRASLISLHRFVAKFVDNPIFKERGVFDITENRKAKQDVDGIISLSDHIKRITRGMRQQD